MLSRRAFQALQSIIRSVQFILTEDMNYNFTSMHTQHDNETAHLAFRDRVKFKLKKICTLVYFSG